MNLFQLYFLDVITKNYVNFRGRARRREFWYFVLFELLLTVALSLADYFLGTEIMQLDGPGSGTGVLSLIASLVIFLPSIALQVRRLHDIGRSGWWMLVLFVPLIGLIVMLVFLVTNSQPGDNAWGPDPKADERD